jgi:tripartite-type tricarboxylate transporter receptor subunit TctC
LATTALLAVTVAQAQDTYPSQNIRFVVLFTASSATDKLARLLANRMTTILGRNIVVENIAGGNGIPASQNVVRAAPDGHTVMITSNTTHAGNQAPQEVPYDAGRRLRADHQARHHHACFVRKPFRVCE